MTISNTASALRPGVCTSATRPTTPYTGQIIYETDTGYLRVWDGSAWDYLSQKQDDTVGLGPTQGLVFLSSGSFNNVGSFDVTGFSSTYTEFLVVINGNGVSNTTLNGVLYDGSTQLNSQYYGGGVYGSYTGTTGSLFANSGASSFYVGRFDATYRGNTSMVFNRTSGAMPNWNMQGFDSNNFYGFAGGGFRNSTATWDRIRISGVSFNITGVWRLYGYRNA